jgi:hypothetical protein
VIFTFQGDEGKLEGSVSTNTQAVVLCICTHICFQDGLDLQTAGSEMIPWEPQSGSGQFFKMCD